MLALCRILFLFVIAFLIFFAFQFITTKPTDSDNKNIIISTDLKDLSPKLSKDPKIQSAINTLSKNIESRLLLVVTAPKSENVSQAIEYLKEELLKNKNIKIASFDFIDSFLEELKSHRFQLLTPSQASHLKSLDDATLIKNAQRNLYRMDTAVQTLPFSDDPLGMLNEYFNEYINSISKNGLSTENSVQTLKKEGGVIFFQALPLLINQGAMQIDTQKKLHDTLKNLGATASTQFSVNILRTGVFFFAADAAEKSEKDIKFISTLSTISIVILLLYIFRSFSVLLLPFASIFIGLICAVAVNHYLYGSIHILTIVFGASLIGIIIDYSLHYFYHLKSHKEISSKKIKKLYTAMALSLVTSIIGYSALGFSDLDTLKKVALFSCSGIFSAWLCVITLGSLTNTSSLTTKDHLLTKILYHVNSILSRLTKRLSFLFWSILVLGISILVYIIGLPANDDPRIFFKPSIELLSQERSANTFTKGFEPGRYVVIKGETIEEVYAHYEVLIEKIEPRLRTSDFFSAMQLMPGPKQQQDNYQLQKRLYQPVGIVDQFLAILGLPQTEAEKLYKQYKESSKKVIKPQTLFNQENNLPPVWIEEEGKIVSFILINKGVNTAIIETASEQLDNVTFINTIELSQKALVEQRESATTLLLIAYGFIAILILVFYKSASALWILLVPLSATIGTLSFFTLFNIDITLFTIMGLFLILGLGMDYVIFIKEMNEDNSTTQNAILLSTITTLLSFGLLSVSTIPVAQAFGMTLLVGNTINFFAALIYANMLKKYQLK